MFAIHRALVYVLCGKPSCHPIIDASVQLRRTHQLPTSLCKVFAYEEKLMLCRKIHVLKVLEGHQHADIDVTPIADGIGLEISKVGHDASRRGDACMMGVRTTARCMYVVAL